MAAGIKIKPETAESPALTPEKCEVYKKSKTQRQVSRRPASRTHIHRKFRRLHFDLISHLYCEGIRLHLAQTHEKKSGCINTLIAFIAICRSQFNIDILVLKSDREPTLHSVFHKYYPEAGISVEFSVVGTPEQNGFIERIRLTEEALAGGYHYYSDFQYKDSEHERPQYDLDNIALETTPNLLPTATQNETSVSDQEALVRTIDHAPINTQHKHIESTPPLIITPSPTPTPAAPRNEALPGAFPTNRTEAKGVRALDTEVNPNQQLLGKLSNTIHQPTAPPPGYRLRGELAPRDIEGSFTTNNIIEGSRTRSSKRAHFTQTKANKAAKEEPEEYHKGFLMAFNAVFTNKRPHREDLPPAPRN
ncbi:uncharacterized protein N7473_001589 [Penicillium subrubescens]|uniref:uncharacterized protein n=1 Tax=Penicillium subrubescens TaxID=1316194 RepID=UPI002545000D|nr:uncharacterized protein N7473_001589 [Penicillium subrubescens]KAJ5904673.1 hypothetical protein N7473_001589 [Penicillium subrubescens]